MVAPLEIEACLQARRGYPSTAIRIQKSSHVGLISVYFLETDIPGSAEQCLGIHPKLGLPNR